MRATLIALFVAAACTGSSAHAEAVPTEESSFRLGGNFSLVSDYMFRGISVSDRKPAVQGGIDLTHRNGSYLSLWASSVSDAPYNKSSGQEIDILLGHRFALPQDWTLETGLALYYFPGAQARSATGDGQIIRYDTQELKLAVTRAIYNLTMWTALNHYWSGIDYDNNFNKASTRGSTYVEVNANPPLSESLTLNLHAGRQIVRHFSNGNFNDYRIGLTLDGASFNYPGWSAAVAAIHNTGNQQAWGFYYRDGSKARNSTGSTVLLSLTKTF
ncbi:TorF family putative porin [Herbaspirillum sp. NPDC087042]|uniref:TorF family putative porin n=1 Tax=Herbaspirillum sp. NPDC087042 TaxID=3364004 RepID=UPI0037F6A57A